MLFKALVLLAVLLAASAEDVGVEAGLNSPEPSSDLWIESTPQL